MTLDLIEMGRKACEEGVTVPEQIEAEIVEVEDEIRGLDASVRLDLERLDDVRRNIARAQDDRRKALDLRDELIALKSELLG